MARKYVKVLTSDLSGESLTEENSVSTELSLGKRAVRLDLSKAEYEELAELLDDYLKAGTKVSKRPSGERKTGGSGYSKEEMAAARAWLSFRHADVSERGRIKAEYLQEWEAAGNPSGN